MTKSTYLVLLRGINVGGKNKLAMNDLREIMTDIGCENVSTYIQSGNAVFKAEPNSGEEIAAAIETSILERFGLKIPVISRTLDELQRVITENPFLSKASDESMLHVMFLKNEPTPERVNALDPGRSPGDSYLVEGREIFLLLPNGVANSKLTNAYFDSKLAVISTSRNWRTVKTLREMMEG